MLKNALLLLFLLAAIHCRSQQKFTLSGTITSSSRGETLIGASVSTLKAGTLSNDYGFYSITLDTGTYIVVFSALGMKPKAEEVGFEWENKEQVWEKVEEEVKELKEEEAAGNQDKIEAEFGDLLFSLVNYARFLRIDPENALERTNKKFIQRFTDMEKISRGQGKNLQDMSLAEMDALWTAIKRTPGIE